MATSSDIENALVTTISAAVYPSPAVSGQPVVYVARGWPTEADVRSSVSKNASMIGVYAASGMARDCTKTLRSWDTISQAPATITASVSGNVLTLGGTVTVGNIIGAAVDGVAYTAVAAPSDTLTTLAAALAAQIPHATASGASVTCQSVPTAHVVNGGTAGVEVSRMDQVFRIDIWAPTPDRRDALLAQIEAALKINVRYAMPDGTTAMLMHMQSTGPNDRPSRATEWAQTVSVTMRYATMFIESQPAMAASITNVTGGYGSEISKQSV